MASQDLVTVVLPLKGREEFTARFIRHCEDLPLVIADGSAEPQLWAGNYGDYFYAGYDATLAHWWFKMLLAVDRIKTPYAVIADNDDIVVPQNVIRCARWLESTHPSYVCASGRIQGIRFYPSPITGPFSSATKQYAPYDIPADYGQDDINARVLAGFVNSWSYYAVYRTEALKTIWRDVHDMNIMDLQVHEKFCAMRALTLGKIRCDSSFTSLYRQYGTSIGATSQASFGTRLPRVGGGMEQVLDRISSLGVDRQALRDAWGEWWNRWLTRNYGTWPRLRRKAKMAMPRLAAIVQNRNFRPFQDRLPSEDYTRT